MMCVCVCVCVCVHMCVKMCVFVSCLSLSLLPPVCMPRKRKKGVSVALRQGRRDVKDLTDAISFFT